MRSEKQRQLTLAMAQARVGDSDRRYPLLKTFEANVLQGLVLMIPRTLQVNIFCRSYSAHVHERPVTTMTKMYSIEI